MNEKFKPTEKVMELLKDLSKKVKGIFRSSSEKQKTKEELSAEQKAQQAFFEVILESYTPEGLQVHSKFEPPHSVFDLTKLGDGAVFRINFTINIDVPGSKHDRIEYPYTAYACCVVNPTSNTRELYIPDSAAPFKKGLFVEYITDQTIKNRSYLDVEVTRIEYQTPTLDWNNPSGLFAPAIYQTEIPSYLKIEFTLNNIEVVAGGKTESAKKPASPESILTVPQGSLAPQPN